MSVKLIFVVLGGIVLSLVDNARILPRVKRQSLKVRITAKDDSIVLQYLSTSPVIKLQGYVLGLGGRFSRQNITLPVNGDPIEVDVEFNPKYLVAVHPVAEQNKAVFGKKCKGHLDLHKPPKLTIDPRTPTSVFLTWAPHSFKDKGYKVGKECEIERQFTVRYREKERDKEWKYQFCPTSETTINNLKPNTVYEFGIQVTKAKEGGNWSKPKTYTTTVTPQPRSTTNGQSKNESNKPEVNFNSGNTKHTRKHGLTERTNDGMRKVKGLGAPSSANNRTNWTLLLPKEPDLNTKAVIGGQSTSNSADVHPGKSSSPKPVITSKPEHTRDRLHDKEVIKKETTNTVSKPALKRSKTRKANDKPAMKPLTTKESKLSSSATPSFPSKPMLNSDRTEIQFPVFLTPSTASEHDTMDEFTEPEMPSSTKMPFNILRTTSDHTDVGNQELPEIELPSSSNSFLNPPDTPSALDSMGTKQFTEPEMPPTSSKLFDPTSEPDDMDTQTFTEPKIRYSSTSSLNPVPESVTMDTEILPELPSSTSSFSSSSDMVSKPDVVHTEWFTERVVEPTANSFFTTSNTIYEFDSPQREQISVPEFGKPFLSSSPVNSLESSKNDAVEPKQSTESSFTTSKAFITSNPITDADNKVQQPFADYALLDSDTPITVYEVNNPEEKESTVPAFDTSEVFTLKSDNELVASDSSHVFNPITQTTDTEPTDYVPMYDINNVSTLMTDHEIPVTDTPNVIYPIPEPESVTISDIEPADHAISTFHTPKTITVISGSKLPNPGMFNPITQSERPEVTGYMEPTADAPNMFRTSSGTKSQIIDTPVFTSIPESVPTKIRVTEVTDHTVSSSQTPNVVTLLPGHKQPVSDSPPHVLNPAIKSEPAKIRFSEVTEDHELSTSHTAKVFTLISGHERQATDIPSVINPIPEPDPAKIGEAEFTEDHELSTLHTAKVFTLISGYERQATDIPSVINPIPEPDPTEIGEADITEDHELSTSHTTTVFSLISGYEQQATDIPSVINPIPELDPAKIGEAEFTEDHELSTLHTAKVFTLISGYERQATDIPSVINPIPEPDLTEIGEADITEDHELSTSHTTTVFSLISGYEQQATDIPSVINPIPELDPAKIGEAEFTENHELSTSHTTKVFTLISGYERQATDIPSVINPIPEPVPTNIVETDVTEDHELSTSHTTTVFSLISGYERQATDIPSVINPIPEPDPAKIGEAEFTEDHELSTAHTTKVFSFISGYERQATDIPSVINPIPQPDPTKIGEADVTDINVPVTDISNVPNALHASDTTKIEDTEITDQVVPTSDTSNVFTLMLNHELPVTDVIDPILESQQTRMRDTEVADHLVSTSRTPKVLTLITGLNPLVSDTPNVINPIPETERAKIKEFDVTDHEVPTSNMFSLIPDSDPPATDIPNILNPITKSEDIGDIKVADDEVPSSDIPFVVTLMPNYVLPLTDTPNTINPIPEPELANVKDTEVKDHEVKISEATTSVFTLMPDGGLPVTDIANVINPIPEPEHAQISDTEDHEPSTSKTAKLSNPTHVYNAGEKKQTEHKLPISDTSHVFIPTPVSEIDHIEDKKFTDRNLTNSGTSHVLDQSPISERGNTEDQELKAPIPTNSETSHSFSSTPKLGKKEDKEIADYTQLNSGTSPNIFNQEQRSALDNIENKDLADYKFSSSDTPNVFRPTPVSQVGNNGKKDHSVSDPPKDSSSIITSKPVHKTNAKVDRTGNGAETTSTVIRSSSSSSGTTQDKPPVFRSTPVSNIDGQGQERFRGTHVIYLKNVTMPCSITESLKHFPEENNTNAKFLNVPRYPPSNVTIVTVEGCPTFLIIGWMNNENDTAEYEVTSQMQGPDNKTEILVTVTNQTHTAVENLKPNTSYSFSVTPTNVHGRGPPSDPVPFVTESADPSVSEYIPGKDAIWTQYKFKFDSYSECQGKRFVKRTRYRKFVGIVLCNSLRYKIYLSNSLSGTFYNIGDLSGHGEDHCQFVDSFLDGRTGEHLLPEQLPIRQGFYRSVRQEPVMFGTIGGQTHIHYVHWYECGIAIPGQW
ncbi:target of Nesh-SH3 isoform X30 [Amblyraja radiata]|uniref:target of Nesh-SH3 isoform X30 n=1 Tax=Amblyraja radiata TaxID=386614 RepID=UPI001403AE40|nr:target of Nesh-SH3 isoform X30 [Amblyraja radiata]